MSADVITSPRLSELLRMRRFIDAGSIHRTALCTAARDLACGDSVSGKTPTTTHAARKSP